MLFLSAEPFMLDAMFLIGGLGVRGTLASASPDILGHVLGLVGSLVRGVLGFPATSSASQ